MPSVARGRPEPDPSPPAAPPPGVALPAALEQRRRVLAVVLDVARLALAALVGGQAAGVPLAVLEVEVRDVPLALQAAADALDDFPDGVWLVPLASISDPDLASPRDLGHGAAHVTSGTWRSRASTIVCCGRTRSRPIADGDVSAVDGSDLGPYRPAEVPIDHAGAYPVEGRMLARP